MSIAENFTQSSQSDSFSVRLKNWSNYLSWVVVLIALLVLAGWQFNIEFLKRPLPGLVAMNPVTAILFMLSGVSCLLLAPSVPSATKKKMGILLSLLVVVISCYHIVQESFGLSIQIDTLIYSHRVSQNSGVISNRMAINSAVGFLLSGVGLLLLNFETRHERLPAQYIAISIAFIGLFSILGYLYKVNSYYTYLAYVPMAIHTAIGFLLLALIILFSNPQKGIMREFTGPYLGSITARILIPVAIVFPVLLGFIRLMSHWSGNISLELGTAMLIVSITAIFLVFIRYNTVLLNKRDEEAQFSKRELLDLNQDLEDKVAERTKEARQVEQRFQTVVEATPNALILVNQNGIIELVNSETEKLFGYHRDELVHKSVEILIPMRFSDKHPHFRNIFFNQPEARTMGAGRDLYAIRKNQSEFPVEIGLNPIEIDGAVNVLASIIDITERKKAEERFRLVVESAPNAMVLVNTEGKITLVNRQTEKLFGYQRKELIGQEVEILIPARYRMGHFGFKKTFFTKPQNRAMGAGRDLFATRNDGSEFPVEIGLNPIETPEGTLVLASIIDITERKLLEVSRLKSDFLANMSHELRTPLNAILGFSELLIDKRMGVLNEKQLEYLKDIHAGGSHLLQLINNVLDLSKIEAGKAELSVEKFDLIDITEGVINVLMPIANKSSVKIISHLSEDVRHVVLDKKKYKQILFNLLSNAIKFNRSGGEVVIETLLSGNSNFKLSVTDTGKGIAKEDLKKLFIPFVQLDAGSNKEYSGSGLGLSLTKNLVELHKGKITVDSKLNEGTTFLVSMAMSIDENLTFIR